MGAADAAKLAADRDHSEVVVGPVAVVEPYDEEHYAVVAATFWAAASAGGTSVQVSWQAATSYHSWVSSMPFFETSFECCKCYVRNQRSGWD